MIRRFLTLCHTVRYLQFLQIRYQIWYRLKSPFIKINNYTAYNNSIIHSIGSRFSNKFIQSDNKYLGNFTFSFLNISHQFKTEIDWNFSEHGKLWTYNLQYFDFLLDENILHSEKQLFVEKFSELLLKGEIKLEPYPVSLRIINWIIFFSKSGVQSSNSEIALKRQVNYLENNLEFHILANHLLENYIALFISGISLQNERLINSNWTSILKQLDEQILEDGGHYECSPMYHSILLGKLLLIYDVLPNKTIIPHIQKFENTLQKMLGWLVAVSFYNKKWAHLNDSTEGIAPTVSNILHVAEQIGLKPSKIDLKQSGYRKYVLNDWEVIFDVGNILPSYQPGHAHSDMLAVCLQIENKAVLVDTGTSTYQFGARRMSERSTVSHNTVSINGTNQSEVWGSFRVGSRASITIHKETPNFIEAFHNGYKRNFGLIHKRSIQFEDKSFVITDKLEGAPKKAYVGVAFFHLDHKCNVRLDIENGKLFVNDNIEFSFSEYQKIELKEYSQAIGFNLYENSYCIKVHFLIQLTTNIRHI